MSEEILQQRVAFCKKLSEVARAKQITQAELAEKTGLKQASISRSLSGKLSPTLDLLLLIANALDVEITIA